MIVASLFFTNLWIILYTNLLQFLNITFPAKTPTEFIRVGASPEPFEMPLYLFLTILMIVAIWFLYRYVLPCVKASKKTNSILKLVIVVFLALVFISNLGPYPMARSTYPYKIPELPLTYLIYFFFYLLTVVVLLLETAILSGLIAKYKLFVSLFLVFIVFIVGLITFEPGFPIVGHDYSYFLGPVWEIIHGKTIYTDVPSQYGFLSILLLSLLYKLNVLHPFYLPVIIWILYIAEYFLIFYLIFRTSKSHTFALLGLISVITLNYFSIYHLPASIPQTGPLRFFPLVLAIFLFFIFKKIDAKKFIFLLALLSFWVLDSGIALILAYLFTLFLFLLLKQIRLKKALIAFIWLVVALIIIFSTINLIHIVFGYKTIDIALVFSKFGDYAKAGFGMIPIDPDTYFWIVLLIYFATIIYVFKNKIKIQHLNKTDGESGKVGGTSEVTLREADCGIFAEPRSREGITSDRIYFFQNNQLLLFSANLSLFASTYFVGRSHPHNLFHISIFPILNAFLLFGLIFKNFQTSHFKLLTSIFLFLLFVVFPLYQRQEVMTKIVKTKLLYLEKGYRFKPFWINTLKANYKNDLTLVAQKIPEKKIVILSPDDTYLFYLTNKENFINDNSQYTILTEKDIKNSLQNVFRSCPKKLIVDCSIVNRCETSTTFTTVPFSIQPVLLNRIEKECNSDYIPIDCANKLCILKNQK